MNPPQSPLSKVRAAKLELYRNKGKIHPRAVSGRFSRLRWSLVWATQLIFFGACWLTWQGHPAVLFDIQQEKFHLFGLTLWPQDALLLAIALILAATGLFLVTALAGRLFCGFLCPQTVYTAIFTWIEAKVEGDHLARLRLEQSPWTPRKLALRTAKHGLWLLFSAWTAITFVGYFTPIRDLLGALGNGHLGPWQGFWLGFYALFTYLQAGFAREAVCQHMCPYSRFQGVMYDPATRSVSYDAARGEPRGRHAPGQKGGDCVDCGICVEVCPTGIDIRQGLQYQCINCGLCIDACDGVMARIGKPAGLIRIASPLELAGRSAPGHRPRLAVYGGLILLFLGLGTWTALERPDLRVDVLRDRGALSRETPEGRIENAYTLRLANLAERPRQLEVSVEGLPGLSLVGEKRFATAPGSVRTVQITVSAPAEAAPNGSRPIVFQIRPQDGGQAPVREKSTFVHL